jgi:glycine/D-amino acid oxidase-like deaminating enzyme
MDRDSFRDKSFWLASGDYSPNTSLEGEIAVDVAIVGGGFTGLSTAYHLKAAEPGLEIALLESQVVGFGASGRNAGFSMTLFGLSMSLAALRFGKAKTKEAHLYMEQAVDITRELITELGIDCDYEHPGFLRVATSPKYEKRIKDDLELAHSLGIEGIEWLGKDQLQEQVSSSLYLGAWWEPRCGLLNPAKLSWGWKDVLESLGVQIFDYSPVLEIGRNGQNSRLKTPKGNVLADKVVLATNAYSHLIPQIKRKQLPIWTYIVLTEPLTDEQLSQIGWQNRQGIEDARNLMHYYRLTADNRLLMGGRDIALSYGADMDRDLNDDIFSALEKDVVDTFPQLRGISFTHRWGGPISSTLDISPAIGHVGDKNMVYSLSYVGHGVSMAHLNGRLLSDLILEQKTPLTDVFFVNRRTIPLPPEPFRRIIASAICGYLRLEDRLYDPKLPGKV